MQTEANSQARVQSEAAFHDARIQTPDEKRMGYAYASVSDVYRATRVPAECLDKAVLEIGCFRGDEAVSLNGFTGRYHGIDISGAAVEYCKSLDLSPSFSFAVDDANVMSTVADGSIDYAFGNGVLHHLDLAQFAPALARKLSVNGVARFVEPAQGNFILRTFRKMTPHLRTPDEHPFDAASLQILREHLSVKVSYHALLRPYLPMLFLNSRLATKAARWADERLLRHPLLQQQAWLLCIELSLKKGAASTH